MGNVPGVVAAGAVDAPGVTVGEGIVGGVPVVGAVADADGEGAVVNGSACGSGRGWLSAGAGRGPSPLLAEGLVGGGAGWFTRLSQWSFWCWSGPSPLLAEGPGHRFPSFLCGVRWWGWRWVLCHSWLRVVGFFGGWVVVSCVVCVCGAGGIHAFVYFVCLWCLCWSQPWLWWWCPCFLRGCVCGVLVVCLVACPRLSGLWLAGLCGCGGCVLWPLASPG